MCKKLAIFGNSDFAKLLKYYVETDLHRIVDCITVDEEFVTDKEAWGVPVIPFNEFVNGVGDPTVYDVMLGVGYSKMNRVREQVYKKIKKYGYDIPSYVHSSVKIPPNVVIGEGNIIFENVTIQAFSEMGVANLIWYNSSIAHDCIIGNFNTICGNSSLSGYVYVKNNCFLGNNCTVKNHIVVGNYTLLGAGAYLNRNTDVNEVIVPVKSVELGYSSFEMNI